MKSAVLATENTKASKVRLGDVCEIIGGGTPSKKISRYYEGDIPWASVRDMTEKLLVKTEFKITEEAVENSATNIIPKGEIIISTHVGLGKICILGQDTAINQDLKAIIPNESLSRDYLYQWFVAKGDYIKAHGHGVTVMGVNLDFIRNLSINLPSLTEQKRIAAELDLITEMIRNREAQLARLDILIKSKFEEMFGGGFEMRSFGEICEFLRNGANIRQDKLKIGVPITRIETLSKGVFNKDRLGYASIMDAKEYSNHIMREGDLLISHINSFEYVGRTVQYRGEVKGDIIHGMNLLRARLLPNHDPTYVEFYLTSDTAQKYFRSVTKKAVNQASMAISDLRRLQIPLPPLALQKEFAAVVEEVDKSKAAIKKTIENLKTLYKARLQEYFA